MILADFSHNLSRGWAFKQEGHSKSQFITQFLKPSRNQLMSVYDSESKVNSSICIIFDIINTNTTHHLMIFSLVILSEKLLIF